MPGTRHRRCIVLRGSPDETAEGARRLTAALDPAAVLWVGDDGPDAVPPSRAKTLLGRSFDAVVLDLSAGLDADVFAQCHGLVWGGGALVLRMPKRGAMPLGGRERLAVLPHGPEDVGMRFHQRFERRLAEAGFPPPPDEALPPAPHVEHGSAEQAALVERIAGVLRGSGNERVTVLADRGRGKSSALGLAIARASRTAPLRIAVTAPRREAAEEIFRFAGEAATYLEPKALLASAVPWDAAIVDEAAQLPVPLLRRLVARFEDVPIAFATTSRGYEGTGRGFVLRFLDELRRDERPLLEEHLAEPIRWSKDDPLERFVWDALLLDAQPALVDDPREVTPAADAVEHRVLDRDALAADEGLLRDFFGLMVHAHYRTTPSDLHRMLDAPNVRLHALFAAGRVVAATLVALEGGLPEDVREALSRGSRRIRGHALPETLICHSGETEAGGWSFVRSVRIATHPALRRRGLARRLVAHVHATYAPDAFGTMFGATPELLRFRRAVGYALVRVGASRGVRTGEPAAVMLHPMTERARALTARLRGVLARDLPVFVALSRSGDDLPLDPDLEAAVTADLPEPAPLSSAEIRRIVTSYAEGPRTYEAAASALEAFVGEAGTRLDALSTKERVLVEERVLARRAWTEVAERAGYETVPAAMRALRRAVAALLGAPRSRP